MKMKKRQVRQAKVFKAIAEASLTGLGDIVTKRETFSIAYLRDTEFGVHTMCGLFNQKHELLFVLRNDDLGITPTEDIMDEVDAIVHIIWGKKPYRVLF